VGAALPPLLGWADLAEGGVEGCHLLRCIFAMGICPQLTIVILGWSRRVLAVKIIFLMVVLLLLVLLGVLALGWLLGSVGCVAG
jgi:hypothetical protein